MSQNKKRKSKKKNKFAVFMGIVWALIVGTYIFVIVSILGFTDSYGSRSEYVFNEIAAHNYGSVLSRSIGIMSGKKNIDEYTEYAEIIALSEYEGAAAMYKMYSENGSNEKASYYKEKMNEAMMKLGDLSFATEDIDVILSLEN